MPKVLATLAARKPGAQQIVAGRNGLCPELFAVPVDTWFGDHFAIAVDTSLAGQSSVAVSAVAQDFQ